MILFSVMFSMFLFSASSLFVHTLLYMSSLSISPPPSLRLCLPPRGRRTPKFADATELMYLCQCFIIVLLNRYTHVPLFFPHLIISPSSSLFTVRRIKAQQQSIILIKRWAASQTLWRSQSVQYRKELPDGYPFAQPLPARTAINGQRYFTGADGRLCLMAAATRHQHEHRIMLPAFLACYI